MSDDWSTFANRLKDSYGKADEDAFTAACGQITDKIRREGTAADSQPVIGILKTLRDNRDYPRLMQVADLAMQIGLNTPEIRKLYAQSLLDEGAIGAALPFLEALVKDIEEQAEYADELAEARGLLGRAWKQIYVGTADAQSTQGRLALNNAIRAYGAVYKEDPTEYSWHGINAAALLRRAAVDGVKVYGVVDPEWRSIALAQEILGHMEMKWLNNRATMWDCATALEASVALKREKEARRWLDRYVREPSCNAFELASTLRQMTDVWQLDAAAEPGASLLPLLQAELLNRPGGQLRVTPQQLSAGKLQAFKAENLEKIFGKVRHVSYKFMLKAIERSRSVARIEHAPGQGYGTGFVIRGGDLHPQLGDELLLLTNAHVISDDATVRDALHPHEASVTFELLKTENAADDEYAIKESIWTSPPHELDATLLRLEKMPEQLTPYPVARRLPLADGEQRVYVIGHPRGGSLSFSIEDNQLLDHEAPRLHYRAPTEGGSSGSPVFNAKWELIGLHHAGSDTMRRLNKKEGVYEANEGLWIQSIKEQIQRDLEVI